MNKIIIDTDPGIDDAQAIAFAIAHPEIDLIGLTSVFGNADIEITTRNALILLEKFGRADIPVAKGAAAPLTQERFAAPDFVHGVDGLGNLDMPQALAKPIDETAAEFIVRSANQWQGELSLVAIGPLSNIAEALMLDAELPNKVKQLVVMGGTVSAPGNVTPLAEANFICDPHAADLVLAHDWPLKIIGLDVTLQTQLDEHHLELLRDNAGDTGQFLYDSGQFYLDFYTSRARVRQPRACAMHDASAVVYLIQPQAFGFVEGGARVVSSGIALGQLAIDTQAESYLLPDWEGRPAVAVAISVDSELVLDTFLSTLVQHSPV